MAILLMNKITLDQLSIRFSIVYQFSSPLFLMHFNKVKKYYSSLNFNDLPVEIISDRIEL